MTAENFILCFFCSEKRREREEIASAMCCVTCWHRLEVFISQSGPSDVPVQLIMLVAISIKGPSCQLAAEAERTNF